MPLINCSRARMMHQLQLRGRYHVTKDYYQKRTETTLHKRFLKGNLAHVGMVQCMNALADKVQKQDVPRTQ